MLRLGLTPAIGVLEVVEKLERCTFQGRSREMILIIEAIGLDFILQKYIRLIV